MAKYICRGDEKKFSIGGVVVKLQRIAILVCMAILICSLNFNFAFSKDNISVGKVSLINGDAQICRSEQTDWVKLNQTDIINVDDRIKLGDGSKLEVCYVDGNILRVGPNSELEFALESVKLFNGQTWFRIVKVGSKFEVVAPTFVAGVRGTVFSVKVDKANKKDTGAVKVWKGTVETKTSNKSTMLTEGLQANVEGNSITEPSTFDVRLANEFSEGDWQASNEKSAYTRYIDLLFAGIDQAEAGTNPEMKKQLETRKKLPEVSEAYNTYKNFSDMRAIENVSGQ